MIPAWTLPYAGTGASWHALIRRERIMAERPELNIHHRGREWFADAPLRERDAAWYDGGTMVLRDEDLSALLDRLEDHTAGPDTG